MTAAGGEEDGRRRRVRASPHGYLHQEEEGDEAALMGYSGALGEAWFTGDSSALAAADVGQERASGLGLGFP